MGKSTAAQVFASLGIPVHDADHYVHKITAPGGEALPDVASAFPDCMKGGILDRRSLGERAFRDPGVLDILESILHPRVRAQEIRFLAQSARRQCPIAVLDIPLLFETGAETRCDAVSVVSAPLFVQMPRVLKRTGMTAEKFDAILARQISDKEKRRRADYIIPTGLGRYYSLRCIESIVAELGCVRGRRWPPRARQARGDPQSRTHPHA